MTGVSVPLLHQLQLSSSDIEETKAVVAQAFCPHALSLELPGSRLEARYHAAQVGGIGLHYLDYGTAVRVAPGELGDFFLVEIPLGGFSEVTAGKQSVIADEGTGVVLSPNQPIETRRSAGSPQLILRIDRKSIESHLYRILNRQVNQPLHFSPRLPLDSPAGRSLLGLVTLLRCEVENGGALLGEPLALARLEELLMTHLLLSQPNTHSETLHSKEPAAAPVAVRLALEIIETRAAEPLTVADIAAEVHVSVRVLQEGFRRHVGCSPTEHLREIRLRRAHAALVEADAQTSTVASVAVRWGFLHMGRFSVEYGRRFGESPSLTLRRPAREAAAGGWR
ncbi:AraC family transcriptional regulator [Streptomyces sp. NBC_00882]|uniref:AraC family transcriptional regulator n=1 Tax=Streptomyces TaxID=1883 RepID=UPI0038657F8F|nr:AraC family transcriptional regulator [Streptomyces sp. NBC_00882]WSZ63755.1 AraC family transcriptional regulator [Streptomyces canus]